jgi:hypothetical protein
MTTDPSNLSSSEHQQRPKKRAKSSGCVNIQMTLGFSDAGKEETPALVIRVLMHIATSTELVRIRQVCRAFRNCSDKIAEFQVARLIGRDIRPMTNQSMVGLLHGAEEANDYTRRRLKLWNADIRAEGFDIGLPTNQSEENKQWHLLAQIPCDPLAPGANVPVLLQLRGVKTEDKSHCMSTMGKLPSGFFHMNADSSGTFYPLHEVSNERNLNDPLRRIRSDLLSDEVDLDDPQSINPYIIYDGYAVLAGYPPERNLELYKEYISLCMNEFYGYKLGHPIPKLDVFQKLVETKVELMKTKYEVWSLSRQGSVQPI